MQLQFDNEYYYYYCEWDFSFGTVVKYFAIIEQTQRI